MNHYGIAVRGQHVGEYTICHASDMATCPYHENGSHKLMTEGQVMRANEGIIAGHHQERNLKKRHITSFHDRPLASAVVRNRIRRTLAVALAGVSLWSLAACGQTEYTAPPVESASSSSETVTSEYQNYLDKIKDSASGAEKTEAYKEAKEKLNDLKGTSYYKHAESALQDAWNDAKTKISTSTSNKAGTDTQAVSGTDSQLLSSWNSSEAPNYYAVTGKANLPSDLVAPGKVDYQGLDSLGRTGYAHANITEKMIADSAGWRAPFDDTANNISGWKNPTTGRSNNGKTSIVLDTGKTYHGYFYNRSHLVADSLGGAPTRTNLITGTRMQNVGDNSSKPGGMAYTESQVRDYMKIHKDVTTAYYATPVYKGNEIVPRGVTVDVRTSDGAIDEHVVVWNYANGHTIDYTTGAWK
jgi:DNA-entry nuclease